MKSIYALIAAFTLVNLSFHATAQGITFPIHLHDGQVIETCNGFFTDSGGDTLTPYSPGENFSVTLLADQGNDDSTFIRLAFLFFDLGEGDEIRIYDGEDPSAPILAIGTEQSLKDETIWSTGTALHIVFTSDPEEETAPGWMAAIECFENCDALFLDITTGTGSFDFCPDTQQVSFSADADYYGGDPQTPNFTYEWNFDGETKTGSVVTHNYDDPGAYPFRVAATDANNTCSLDTIITVRLATIPTFNGTQSTADTVCAGEFFSLIGMANPTQWTGFPTAIDSLAQLTPDKPYTSTLAFDVFPDDQQIVFTEDFDRVCIIIEHIDFGPLTFELECPNGTKVTLKENTLGGASLGEPVQFFDGIPGVGYEYCFSTAPQFGLMEETAFQTHDYTDQAGDVYFNQPFLPAGSYGPAQPLNSLIGCPLNGEWTLHIQDEFQGVSGFVEGWSMFFNQDFYPDSLIFTPEFVEEKWFSESGTELGENPLSTSINEKGDHQFVFRATDNFGCQWDTIIDIHVLPLPEASIESEFEIPVCEGDSTILTVLPDLIGDEIHWLYQWLLEGEELPNRIFDTIMAKQVATYSVRVTDTITGCSDIFDLIITDQNCDLNIPNVFTPNNDGVNDFFEIENLEHYPGSIMVIYNRHGRKVYEHNDYYQNWWDGGNQPDGTYYYVLTYERQGERKQTQGIITIVR